MPAISLARHGTRGSPWGWQEPLGLTHRVAVPATSLSVGKTLLLLAALFEKLFTKMLQAVKGDPQAFSKLTAYSFLEKGVKINKLASGKRQEPFDCMMGGCHRPGKGRSKRRFGQDSPEPAPLSSVPVKHQCRFLWKPCVVQWYPRGHSPTNLAPAGEGKKSVGHHISRKTKPQKSY